MPTVPVGQTPEPDPVRESGAVNALRGLIPQANAVDDRRNEQWPTAVVKYDERSATYKDDARFLKQSLTGGEEDDAAYTYAKQAFKAKTPSSEMAKALGRDDIKPLTKEDLMNFYMGIEALNPNPRKR